MNNVSTDIYRTQVSTGVAIAWANSYSAVVVKTPGATLLFDPVGMDVPECVSLDLIAVSHGHSDHWEPALITELRGRTGSTVAAPPSLAAKLRQDGGKIPPTPLLERGAKRDFPKGGTRTNVIQITSCQPILPTLFQEDPKTLAPDYLSRSRRSWRNVLNGKLDCR